MNNEARYLRIRSVAEAVVTSLGHRAPAWAVLEVEEAAAPTAAEGMGENAIVFGSSYPAVSTQIPSLQPRSILVTLGVPDDSADMVVAVHFSLDVPEAAAIVALASQIQDHASEVAWGQAMPPCPEHSHPLAARVFEGNAVWECPEAPDHYRTQIYPAEQR
jgi:hypothetical protein